MNCMREKGENTVCPYCGYTEEYNNDRSIYLPLRTELQGRYVVGKCIGQGGFGITYAGYDKMLAQKVAIKEFYPSEIAQRIPGQTTVAAYTRSDYIEEYNHGKAKFVEEARILAKFSGYPGIVGIRDCVEANGTAYIIMQYLDGMTLKEYLKKSGGVIKCEDALNILDPVMDALDAVHKVNIIHRDISPDNIFITNDYQVKLLDFGAARSSIGGGKSLSIMLKPGYAPEEQYRSKGNQGPWTDVYALCATLYRMVTGSVPPDSLERLVVDGLRIPDNLPDNIKYVLRRGLSVYASERIQSISEIRKLLVTDIQRTSPAPEPPTPKPPTPKPPTPKPPISKPPAPKPPPKKNKKKSGSIRGYMSGINITKQTRYILIVAAACVLVFIAAALLIFAVTVGFGSGEYVSKSGNTVTKSAAVISENGAKADFAGHYIDLI